MMTISKKPLAVAAAFAGLLAGTAARAAQPAQNGIASATAGVVADGGSEKKQIEKHACKGQNSCKGQGGGDKKHWGKNACKGQGACATDGSKPKM
jgi:hypothetical protein